MGDDGRFCEMTEKRRGRGFGLRFAAHINNQNSESSVNLERGGDREEVLKGRHLLTFLRRSLYIYIYMHAGSDKGFRTERFVRTSCLSYWIVFLMVRICG